METLTPAHYAGRSCFLFHRAVFLHRRQAPVQWFACSLIAGSEQQPYNVVFYDAAKALIAYRPVFSSSGYVIIPENAAYWAQQIITDRTPDWSAVSIYYNYVYNELHKLLLVRARAPRTGISERILFTGFQRRYRYRVDSERDGLGA